MPAIDLFSLTGQLSILILAKLSAEMGCEC
jgi:hypothetical protein